MSMTILPTAVGLVFLGDKARAGLEWLAFAGFDVTLASVLGLTPHPVAAGTDASGPAGSGVAVAE